MSLLSTPLRDDVLGPGWREVRSALLVVSAFLAGVTPAVGQEQRAERDSATLLACAGQRITTVEFLRQPPPLAGARVPAVIRPVMRALLQHRQTRPQAIEPFMLLGEGDACAIDRLAESERLLRVQPYLADATIRATSDGAGGTQLQVETVDEIPVIVGGGIRDGSISKVTFGNGNVLGYGALALATWREGFAYRDGFGVSLAHYHLVGRATAEVTLMRGTFEEEYGASLSRPWLTDVQHTAWHVGAERREGYVRYLRPDEPALSLPLDRDYLDAGALLRLGGSALRLMGGVVASYEQVDPGSRGVVIADTGFAADPDTVLVDRFGSWKDARVGAVLGGRWLAYREMIGLDSLTGRQDVATGVQMALTAGHGLSSGRRDPFGALDFYAALGSGSTLLAVHAIAEARFVSSRDWDDVVASGHIVWSQKPSVRRMRVVRAEFSGEWDATMPLQLTISDRLGGIRGYRGADEAGARRALLRVEERLAMGGIGRLAGFGLAGFADVGKLWAGDAPFGESTGLRPSVGAGVMVAVPRRSQRLYRLDVAVPLIRDAPTKSWSVRLSAMAPYQAFWREPGDVRRMRAGLPAADLLAWR
ncbi:MAG TPA: hypothetical protein VK922_04670 [Gemmatimonadaceae bacterium]|nr:hypothetical protein [Gemmatimonadaceae bacterium]